MKPDATKHNPDPEYIRELLDKIPKTTKLIAETIGLNGGVIQANERELRHYKAGSREIPYLVQFALECLAEEDTP